MKTHRTARIAEVIREVASTTILFDMRDPRVKNVTVTRAEVSGDLQHAKVYVSVMGSEKQQRDAMHGLRNAAGYIQSKLADRLLTRFLPVLSFVKDAGVKKSLEIAKILAEEKRLQQGDAANTVQSVDETPSDSEDDNDGTTEDGADTAGNDGPTDQSGQG
jgi:ribosome-binding factor A